MRVGVGVKLRLPEQRRPLPPLHLSTCMGAWAHGAITVSAQ